MTQESAKGFTNRWILNLTLETEPVKVKYLGTVYTT